MVVQQSALRLVRKPVVRPLLYSLIRFIPQQLSQGLIVALRMQRMNNPTCRMDIEWELKDNDCLVLKRNVAWVQSFYSILILTNWVIICTID